MSEIVAQNRVPNGVRLRQMLKLAQEIEGAPPINFNIELLRRIQDLIRHAIDQDDMFGATAYPAVMAMPLTTEEEDVVHGE